MIDLTKITAPFGLLDEETQKALRSTGKTIENYTVYGKWEQNDDPSWHCHIVYRVKPQPPKPREWWLNIYNDGYGYAYFTKEQADEQADKNATENRMLVHVREVLE